MKKIKYFVILSCIILVNIFLINAISCEYKQDVNMTITAFSEQDVDFQVFNSQEKSFTEEKSETIIYESGNAQKLTFQIPYDTQYIRMDFGNSPAQIQLSGIAISVGNVQKELLKEFGNQYENINMMELINDNDGITITTLGNDPYIMLSSDELKLSSVVEEYAYQRNLIRKFSLCAIFDLVCLLVFVRRKKISAFLKDFLEKRSLILDLAVNDFKTKYAGSYLGIIWAFVQPTVTIMVYWFVFQVGFRSGSVQDVPFVLWLMAGLVPWFFFNEALNSATSSLLDYSYLVKKVVFNIGIIPIVRILSSLFVHIFFVVFMLYLFLLNGFNPCLEWIQLLYYSVCLVALVAGITYMTSALVVFFRDLAQIILVVLQVLMWVTPIMWNWEIMPEKLQIILKLNPLYYIVEGYRNAVIRHEWFWNDTYLTIYFWIVTIICIIVGNKVFNKLKVHFADVI